MLTSLACSALLVASVVGQASADTTAASTAPGWAVVGFPYANFGSDEGLGYGVVGGAYLEGPGEGPSYRLAVQPTLFITTEGRRDLTLFVDAPGMLPEGWRFDLLVGLERHLAVPYYGVGNDSPYRPELEEGGHPSYYRFGRDRRRIQVNLQRSVPGTALRVLAGVGAARTLVDPAPRDGGTTLRAEELGSEARLPALHTRTVRLGVVRDTRDHETVPRRGSWSELLVDRAVEAFGGSLGHARWTAADRRFIPVTDRLVVANRLVVQELHGDAPPHELMRVPSSFREQEGLGGAGTVRGLPQNRFVGRGLFLWNLELRGEADEVRILRLRLRPGFVAFVDSGRVWEERVRITELLRDLHHGLGLGLRARLGESFVVSADLGRSAGTGTAFYLGVGHAF